jgi:hypothetical protein
VPRPVKTEAPVEDRPKGTPPPARPSTPAGTDPVSTPGAPALNPPPQAAPPSPIVPAVAPAAAERKPVAAPPRVAAPPAAPARPSTPAPPPAPPPADFVPGATVVDTPALGFPATPPAAPIRIGRARFAGEKFAFDLTSPGRFEVGRSASTAFRVDHTTVSRRHAALTLSEDRAHLSVEDLGAANGTRVNGQEIKGTRALREGDVLELGEVKFTLRLERA